MDVLRQEYRHGCKCCAAGVLWLPMVLQKAGKLRKCYKLKVRPGEVTPTPTPRLRGGRCSDPLAGVVTPAPTPLPEKGPLLRLPAKEVTPRSDPLHALAAAPSPGR